MSSLVDQFTKIENAWKNVSETVPADGVSAQHLFELAYHAANAKPDRCIQLHLEGGDQGGDALLFNVPQKMFKKVTSVDGGVVVALFKKTEERLQETLDQIVSRLSQAKAAFAAKSPTEQEQIATAILVERKVDEVINRAADHELARAVYFAIGECRERMALVPLLMEAEKASIVQLALNRYMSAASNMAPDAPFPEEALQGTLKNFLQIKSWILAVISKALA
ncbi:MAG: hypothetical protein Kow0069_17730 [Promethearchaeota archaeon]